AGIRRDAIKERVSVVGAVRLDSAECATTNSRKSWDGRATESTGTKSMKRPRPCVYGCGASEGTGNRSVRDADESLGMGMIGGRARGEICRGASIGRRGTSKCFRCAVRNAG